MAAKQESNYLAFLVRLRRDNESAPWRVTIEDPHSGEKRGFAGLAEFMAYLAAVTGTAPEVEAGKAGSKKP
jgi:hypothetical protein